MSCDKVFAIGASLGGYEAMEYIFKNLSESVQTPFVIVQHVHKSGNNLLTELLNDVGHFNVKWADEKEKILPKTVYIAPPNYHLLIEENFSLSLSADEPESFSRPSIDILFESLALAIGEKCTAILLTGANADGSKGLKYVYDFGGTAIVQNPLSAHCPIMPKAGYEKVPQAKVLTLDEIIHYIESKDNE